MSPSESDLYATNRTKIPLLGKIQMDFTVEAGDSYSVKLAVTNAIDDFILGSDWLTEQDVQWSFGQGKLLLGSRWIKLQQRDPAEPVRRIHATKAVSIPAMSEADVPVMVTWPTLQPVHGDWVVGARTIN